MEFIEQLNFLDIVFIVCVLILSLFSSIKGLVKNIVTLLFMIFSVLLAGFLARALEDRYIDSLINDENTAYFVSFALILIVSYLLLIALMKVFNRNNEEKEGFINTFMAFTLAILKFSFLLTIICATLNTLDGVSDNKQWEDSKLRPYLVETGDYIYSAKDKIDEVDLEDYLSS